MPTDFTWPRPYLLQLYQKAVDEGCIRILLRGPDYEAEFRSLKAAFYRLRRRKDGHFLALMKPEYSMCSIRFEPNHAPNPAALVSYSSLPDGELLPMIESITDQRPLPQPLGAIDKPIPEEEADFDATAHVSKLISSIDPDEDLVEDPSSEQ